VSVLDQTSPATPAPIIDTADTEVGSPDGIAAVLPNDVSRRGFLRGAAIAGTGLVAATIAACTPNTGGLPTWTYGPNPTTPANGGPGTPKPATPAPTAAGTAGPVATPAASGGPIPTGWTQHDIAARQVVRRYVGSLAPALKSVYGDAMFAKYVDVLGAGDNYPELGKKPAFAQVPQLVLNDAVKPLTPTIVNGVKVFKLTVEAFDQQIDEMRPPVAALGYNGQWPGPTIRVNKGDRVRAEFTNKLDETTTVHFHGVDLEDVFMDGVPFVNQTPIIPGATFAYEFTAGNAGSHMYHSHHNATDQVGRGLLGAFIVDDPSDPDNADRDYIWISNDSLGGFTINGHGFPATVPVIIAKGETVRIRFMNEGVMMHPWHSHGYPMKIVARDGRRLGSAAFECDTLGVNPGERYDAIIKGDRLGIWAFHCHILPHVEGPDGMFGMVSTLIVVPEKAHVDAIVNAVLA
jgi:FtsP/CotA-like multicopper oxidase with cupredoxin domain